MKRLSVARCGGYAPEGWQVVSHARDGGIFHVSSEDRASHAIYKTAYSQTPNAQSFILGFLDRTFGTPHVLTPAQPRPFEFVLQGFGSKVSTGFVVYRITDQRTALWAAAVPVDNSKGKALAGAVAFTLQCEETRGLKPYSRDPALSETAISRSCLAGRCSETDLAATYLSNLHLGYAHNGAGEMFLVDPRRDLWQSGEKGPGFYHHTGGINEKLNSGRAR